MAGRTVNAVDDVVAHLSYRHDVGRAVHPVDGASVVRLSSSARIEGGSRKQNALGQNVEHFGVELLQVGVGWEE